MRSAFIRFLLLTFVVTSCTTVVYVYKDYPPEITLENRQVKAVFINNYDFSNSSITSDLQRRTYSRAIKSFIKGMTGQLEGNDSFRVVIGDTLRTGAGAGMLTTLMPQEEIAGYCSGFDSDVLISLDSVNIGFDTRADYLESIGLVNFYSRDFYLYAEYFLSVYSPSGELLNRSSTDREIKYSWRLGITSDVAFDPSVAAAAKKIDSVAIPCGEDFALKFIDQSQFEPRTVYTGSGLRTSVDLMKSGKWDDAVKTLERITGSSQGTKLDHATFNLDVAREGASKNDTLIKSFQGR